jgi:hypothetical protein
MPKSRIAQLAELVLNNTITFDSYLKENGLPTPSFDVDAPDIFGISVDVERARVQALEAAMELVDLLQGPIAPLRPLVSDIHTPLLM